ncbi:MAG: sulfatase-like hydrolase/transferase [Candidatus Poribacteria bacterium]
MSYGDPVVRTPHLDRLAEQGVRFKRCYASNPVCSPSRAIFQTGRYAHQTGLIQNNLYLKEEERCFAEIFSENGYATGYIGKWHLDGSQKPGSVTPGRRQGWQYFEGFNRGYYYPKGAKYFK